MSTCQKEVRGYPRRKQAVGTQAIHYIGRLYKVESDAGEAGLTVEERKEKRIRETYPLILEFEKWLQDAYLRVLPKSRMGKAIEYTYALLPRLSRYVNDGRIEIDDNRIENAISPFGVLSDSLLQVCRSRP